MYNAVCGIVLKIGYCLFRKRRDRKDKSVLGNSSSGLGIIFADRYVRSSDICKLIMLIFKNDNFKVFICLAVRLNSIAVSLRKENDVTLDRGFIDFGKSNGGGVGCS